MMSDMYLLEEADREDGSGDDDVDNGNGGDGDNDNDTKMCFHNPFSRSAIIETLFN